MQSRFSIISLCCAALLLCSSTAQAYIGPIIIIGAVKHYVRLDTAVGVALLIVLSYPFYLLYRRKNKRKQGKTEEGEADIEAEESSAGA